MGPIGEILLCSVFKTSSPNVFFIFWWHANTTSCLLWNIYLHCGFFVNCDFYTLQYLYHQLTIAAYSLTSICQTRVINFFLLNVYTKQHCFRYGGESLVYSPPHPPTPFYGHWCVEFVWSSMGYATWGPWFVLSLEGHFGRHLNMACLVVLFKQQFSLCK